VVLELILGLTILILLFSRFWTLTKITSRKRHYIFIHIKKTRNLISENINVSTIWGIEKRKTTLTRDAHGLERDWMKLYKNYKAPKRTPGDHREADIIQQNI